MKMATPIFKRVSRGVLKGWMRAEILEHLSPPFFDDPVSSIQEMGGKVIKESRWRRAAIFSLTDGRRIFIKRDRTKDWVEHLKYLFFPTKGQKEFFIASQLEGRGVNLPRPLGWMEKGRKGWIRESYFLSEAIGAGVSFIEEVAKSKEPLSIVELAKTVKKFQDAGLFHQDLHAGNFLWDGASLLLTDLHRAKMVRPLSLKRRLWNLAHLFHSLRSNWGEKEQLQFLDQYFNEMADDSQKREILFQKIYPFMNRLQTRQWRSRTKRCLKESTEFTVQKEKGIRTFRRRDFPMDRLMRMMEEHQKLVREKPSCLIKHSPEVNVSILNDGGEKICLKQFRYPHFWGRVKECFRRSKGLKSWVAANGMRTRGIPTLKPLALVEKKSGLGLKQSILFMEALVNDLEMDRYVLKGFANLNKKRLFVKTFAHWLGGLHQMSLYHRDMKTCNILVSERGETWDFHLLDFEDIRMNEKVNGKKLFRNFLQLNTSTPNVMTKVDRFRFFREYLLLHPVVKDQKVFLRKMVDESRRRGLVYVSPTGVVTETMK
jgi:tRNA A-37 threonylcarbamoyl transferase component Bud32